MAAITISHANFHHRNFHRKRIFVPKRHIGSPLSARSLVPWRVWCVSKYFLNVSPVEKSKRINVNAVGSCTAVPFRLLDTLKSDRRKKVCSSLPWVSVCWPHRDHMPHNRFVSHLMVRAKCFSDDFRNGKSFVFVDNDVDVDDDDDLVSRKKKKFLKERLLLPLLWCVCVCHHHATRSIAFHYCTTHKFSPLNIFVFIIIFIAANAYICGATVTSTLPTWWCECVHCTAYTHTHTLCSTHSSHVFDVYIAVFFRGICTTLSFHACDEWIQMQ